MRTDVTDRQMRLAKQAVARAVADLTEVQRVLHTVSDMADTPRSSNRPVWFERICQVQADVSVMAGDVMRAARTGT